MSDFSIPSSLLGSKMSQNIADLRARIKETSTEAVTGRHSDLTRHLSGRIGDAMLNQKALDDITDQRGLLSLKETRLEFLQQSLTSVQDSASGISTRMINAVGGGSTAEMDVAANEARLALDSIFSALNLRHGERYLFAGEATSSQPFGDPEEMLQDIREMAASTADPANFEAQLDTYFNDPAGGWQQDIYNGSTTPAEADGVTGANDAITKLVSGLAVLAISDQDSNVSLLRQNPGLVESAAVQTADGETAVTHLRGAQGIRQQRVADEQAALDVEETILTRTFNDMAGRDQYEAAALLRELESNLEASYLLTSRISNLSLTNYLR